MKHLGRVKLRANKSVKGWLVEIQLSKRHLLFFRKKYWAHIVFATGISTIPWYYDTKERAVEETLKLIKFNLLHNIV